MAITYLTTDLTNSKIYVGFDSHNNPKYYGSGKLLKLAINKRGKENFKKEILEEFDLDDWSLGRWQDRERYWIHFYDATNPEIGYNMFTGGNGSIGNTPWNKNLKNKYKRPGQSTYMKNKWNDPTSREQQSIRLKKYWKTPENIENRKIVSIRSKKLWKNPEFRRDATLKRTGKNNGMYGKVGCWKDKHFTKEHRMNLGKSHKGKISIFNPKTKTIKFVNPTETTVYLQLSWRLGQK